MDARKEYFKRLLEYVVKFGRGENADIDEVFGDEENGDDAGGEDFVDEEPDIDGELGYAYKIQVYQMNDSDYEGEADAHIEHVETCDAPKNTDGNFYPIERISHA